MKQKPVTIDEQKKQDALAFLNCQVKAQKMMRKKFASLGGVELTSLSDDIQIWNLMQLIEILEMPYIREDWDGNEVCDSDSDIIYFDYKGYRFFQLVDKEEN